MNPQLRTVCVLSLALGLAGCSDTVIRDCLLSPVTKSFTLTEPFEFTDSARTSAKGLLAPGVYQCYYMDPRGDYYEAPFTTKPEYFFSGERHGGVYITRTDPRECRLYTQDNRIVRYYSAYSVTQSGGSGKFVSAARLPDEFLAAVKFAEASAGESGHESNPR
jgi:hypothetical protein